LLFRATGLLVILQKYQQSKHNILIEQIS
jgi:hypothetical protein